MIIGNVGNTAVLTGLLFVADAVEAASEVSGFSVVGEGSVLWLIGAAVIGLSVVARQRFKGSDEESSS